MPCPRLVPGVQYLFGNLKMWLYGRRFVKNEELVWETNGDVDMLHKS